MRITLAVLGAGSSLGRHLCRRAVRIGWDVHAYSIYDVETIYKQSTSIRQRTFYNSKSESDWLKHISWITDCNYDENFEDLGNEIRNVTGLVYFYEDTPLLKSNNNMFEENVISLSKLAGNWSVRHFIAVQSENKILNNKIQQQIGQTNPFMIVSLLRPGKIYSYSNFASCLPVYKNRTLRSIGIDTKPINIINAETVAKCITTLIHNTNDPNIYRILEGHDIEQYLSEQNIPFDSPDYDYYDNDNNNIDNIDSIDNDNHIQNNDNDKKNNFISIGYDENKSQPANNINNSNDSNDVNDIRDQQEKHNGKIY
eukprot:424582_1